MPAPHLTTDLEKKRLNEFLKELQQMFGVTESSLQEHAGQPVGKSRYYRHMSYRVIDGEVSNFSTIKSTQCDLLTNVESCCNACRQAEHIVEENKKRQEARLEQPIKRNDPLHCLNHIRKAFKDVRKENARLQNEIDAFKTSMKHDFVFLSEELHNDLKAVKMTNLQDLLHDLFWQEQLKAFKTKSHGMRWHPMMIRLAILIQSKSKAAYETLRKTGVLKLPGIYSAGVHQCYTAKSGLPT